MYEIRMKFTTKWHEQYLDFPNFFLPLRTFQIFKSCNEWYEWMSQEQNPVSLKGKAPLETSDLDRIMQSFFFLDDHWMGKEGGQIFSHFVAAVGLGL